MITGRVNRQRLQLLNSYVVVVILLFVGLGVCLFNEACVVVCVFDVTVEV